MYSNSYVPQSLRIRCSLNFEFVTRDVIKYIFIFFNITKVTQPKLVAPIPSNSSSLHLETTCSTHLLLYFLLIKYQRNPSKIAKRILQTQWTIHSIPEKKHLWYYFSITQSKYLHLDNSRNCWNSWNTSTYYEPLPNFHSFRNFFHNHESY